MVQWLQYALLALLFYGLWGFFPKLATMYLSSKEIIIYEVFGIAFAALFTTLLLPGKLHWNTKGVTFAVLTGLTGMVGTFFFLQALRHGKASVVILLTSLYPMISVILALILLREALSLRQLLAGALAICSLILFALA